ncbi:protein still life, isoforms C/SIF type 2-like isoform X19 [Lutzomyia longipalpis]|uniref:protein still life, isoforms C/SIF type 2-like isoform X19 n=1 Tax=Lutzomyia longipalpis TaxID=7200 RepID=UPI002483C531|nr:protein still life, isoforms C/SIF type 2-like isoform X19 [Lutzomyia longipalpis]
MIVEITPACPRKQRADDDKVTNNNRQAICICNAQWKLQEEALARGQALKRHGSLDQLLQTADTKPPEAADMEQRRRPVPTEEKQLKWAPQKTIATVDNMNLQKYYQQMNGDYDTPRQPPPPVKKEAPPEKVRQFYKSSSGQHIRGIFVDPKTKDSPLQEPDGPVWFDRSQRQRHSSRSVGDAEVARETEPHHQRHSSGPSDLSILKEDIAKLLVKLPLAKSAPKTNIFEQTQRRSVDGRTTTIKAEVHQKDDQAGFYKKPLQRQSSGPSDISVLRNDLLEWLAKQQQTSKQQGPVPAGRKIQKASSQPVPQPRKRHSVGPGESEIEWIKHPIPTERSSSKHHIPPEVSSRKHRRLQHSSSEVVSSHHGSKRDPSLDHGRDRRHGHHSRADGSRSRRNQTQRSATLTDMTEASRHKEYPSAKADRTPEAVPRCTDPNCPLLPICNDPECCYIASCYDRMRYSTHVPRCRCKKCAPKCAEYRCYSLPRCIDSKCSAALANITKCNSLPRCAEAHQTVSFQGSSMSRGDSRASLPRATKPSRSASRSNGKLIKSVSAASLNSRRRRHKTVHFGENLLREVCQNRRLIKPLQQQDTPSGSAPMKPNIQLLFNFIEGVLSAWVDDDDDHLKSGADSEPERGALLKPLHRCNRARFQTIRRVVSEAAALKGTLKLGNSRYRHRHWRGTAKDCNERFLRKISDDDRMSLTTAVSDEDDGESVMASPYKAKATGTAAASFNCTGAVRKAGFLSVKKWLLRKKHQIELARKRGWKGYWVCLKGTTLLFYPCDSREGRSVEAAPKHLIIVDGAIMQPIPEHPKRDYIFCLSTAFGDAYLFQAPCQVELENWVNSIHSACAAAFARHRGKTGTLHLLQEEIFRLEKAIESDHKLKHMAELQQSVVTDQDTRHQIQTQILQWEENLERLHCEQFRLRCYMASLQSGELPNPKSLLTHVSRPTKNTLNKLGVFTVSSFHAFICARSPSLLNNLLAGRGATKRRAPLLSRSNSSSSRRSMQMGSRDDPDKTYKISLPDNNYTTVHLRDAMSVEEFLASACARKNLNPMEHFIRVKKRRDMEDHNYFVPHRNDLIDTYLHTHEVVEVCAKILYQVELQRTTLEQMWGFSVEAELIENADRQDELCCYVSRVEEKSVAMQNGLIKGDEIMVINGAIVSDLDMMYLESVLQEEQALCMMMRSSRTEPPDLAGIMRVTDDMIDSLVCPPPPSDPPIMSEEMISGLIVPAPGWKPEYATSSGMDSQAGGQKQGRNNSFEIENLLKTAEQITGFCRSPQETRKSSPTGSVSSSIAGLAPSRQLSDAEKLRKVILELVDTEKTYVKHLNNLLEYYLEPLKRETFLSNAEIAALFGNIQEIVAFQRQFLQNLEEALELEPDFHKFDQPCQFKNVLFSIGSAFLYYVNHFKLYSSFCASHSKAQKVLHPNEGNQALQEFLAARNPKQQHSSTLESFLIKPIQRILKYPLLLQQLRNLSDPNAEEHLHLVEALKGMEKVAEHINEMQRIHEEYGAIFDHLFRQHQKSCKQPIDLSPGDLLYYGGVEWLNISDFLGKIKKGLELHAMCFVFKSAVVFLCKERLRQKKKLMGVSSKNTPNEVEIIRYQVLIPVTEVQVRASSAKDMDSHFLWELIHLRSQLQRRSEKVYVLSNSTADFRNAFLKTIRQIIRESVRNMSIPMKGLGSLTSVAGLSGHSGGNSQTLERPKQTITIIQGSQTLGKMKKSKTSQRHSAGNLDYDNLMSSQDCDDIPQPQTTFRSRSKTVGDAADPPPVPKRTTSELDRHDPGIKSEGEDDSQHGTVKGKATLGRTPNHLTLSTTSTLSVGSTGSQARLIQSSHAPSTYQPVLMKDLGKKDGTSPSKEIDIIELFPETNGEHKMVDKHLSGLEIDSFDSADTCDIAKYMANLKETHMECSQSDAAARQEPFPKPIRKMTSEESDTPRESTEDEGPKSKSTGTPKKKSSNANTSQKSPVERKKSNDGTPKTILRNSKHDLQCPPDKAKSTGSSPVKIIKIKSPRMVRSPPMKRSLSRDSSSIDMSPRPEGGGILKRSHSSKAVTGGDTTPKSSSILKRSLSPKDLRALDGLPCKSLSPGSSFDARSPDRSSPHLPDAPYPRAAFDRYYSSESDREYANLRSREIERQNRLLARKRSTSRSPDSRSPDYYKQQRMRSLSESASIRTSFDSVEYDPMYSGRSLSASASMANSFEMPYFDYGCHSFDCYKSRQNQPIIVTAPRRYERSPERYGDDWYREKTSPRLKYSNESLTRAIRHPTCVDCLLQSRRIS